MLTELEVHPANVAARAGAQLVLAKAKAAGRQLGTIWIDGGSQAGVVAWAPTALDSTLEVVPRPPGGTGFTVLPRRWVVERTFAWLGRDRRLRTDDEALTATSEAVIWAACGVTMLRRLVKHRAS